MKIVPHEGIHEFKIYDGFENESLYYHYETRRKYRTTFVGVLLLLNSTRLPVSCKISFRVGLIYVFRQGNSKYNCRSVHHGLSDKRTFSEIGQIIPTYYNFISSVYTRTVLMPTTDTDCNVSTRFGEYDISHNPTSHLWFGHSSMGRGNSNVNALSY